MSTYLGIDLGTTATKTVVIGPGGTIVASARAPHPEARSIGRGRVDPRVWMDSVAAACGQLGGAASEVDGVGLSVHCPTALLYDVAGNPLAPGITWDHAGLPSYVSRLADLRNQSERQLAGNRESPATFMIAAYDFFAENEPDALGKAVEFGLVGSWLSRWLTGRSALDPTQASYTGAFAATDGSMRWLDDFLERVGIPAKKLPPIRPSLSVVGAVQKSAAAQLGIRVGIPVVVGAADTPSACFALGAEPSGIPLLLMGTTHVVSNCLAQPDNRALALQRPDVREGQWLINGVTNGGDSLAAGARLLGFGTGSDAVGALVAEADTVSVEDARNAPIYIPHVMPERGPMWLTSKATALYGFDGGTTRASASRGVLEGVLFADRMVVECCTSGDQGEVFLAGSFGSGTAAPQLIADALGRRVRVMDESNLSAIGAAEMAAAVLEGVAVRIPPSRVVTPRGDWSSAIAYRWEQFVPAWERTVGRTALEPFRAAQSDERK